MKIGIYNQPSVGKVNGIESCVVTLAAGLKHDHEVDIVHHAVERTRATLADLYGVELDGVELRELPRRKLRRARNPVRRYRAVTGWLREASEPYDLFFTFGAGMPPYCHAPGGALMIAFPIDERPARCQSMSPWKRLHHRLDQLEWRERLGSYQLVTANSSFTRGWIARRWGVDSRVVYAATETDFPTLPKQNLILSVGRFATGGTVKNQLEMMEIFRDLAPGVPAGWQYRTVGPVGRSKADQAYYERVEALAAECGAEVKADLDIEELRKSYSSARIFWHAAGYGVDPEEHPDQTEHFGIVTVEAMAAGCVPLVIDRGGQPEIVEHGVNGFLWQTLEELRACTMRLLKDDGLMRRMSDAARERARHFGRAAYVERVTQACEEAGLL